MLREIVLVLSVLTSTWAQIPSLGFCPDYVPMANFDMDRFTGLWYEAERYFQLSEVVSRCVLANYTKGPDGKYRVSNEVTNRFTGIKRILEGEIKPAASKAEEGKLHVKYTTIPLTPETKYSVLETDYDNYAVLWSCSGIGPVHTQNAWIMTRQRLPPGEILQKAYGVLDKYKISKTFFVKTDQEDCAFLDSFPRQTEKPQVVEETEEAEEESTEAKNIPVRSSITPDAPNVVISMRQAEAAKKEQVKEEASVVIEKSNQEEPVPATVPELLMKKAEQAKEEKSVESDKNKTEEKMES